MPEEITLPKPIDNPDYITCFHFRGLPRKRPDEWDQDAAGFHIKGLGETLQEDDLPTVLLAGHPDFSPPAPRVGKRYDSGTSSWIDFPAE